MIKLTDINVIRYLPALTISDEIIHKGMDMLVTMSEIP